MFLATDKLKMINLYQIKKIWATHTEWIWDKRWLIIFEYQNGEREKIEFPTVEQAQKEYRDLQDSLWRKVIFINNWL